MSSEQWIMVINCLIFCVFGCSVILMIAKSSRINMRKIYAFIASNESVILMHNCRVRAVALLKDDITFLQDIRIKLLHSNKDLYIVGTPCVRSINGHCYMVFEIMYFGKKAIQLKRERPIIAIAFK